MLNNPLFGRAMPTPYPVELPDVNYFDAAGLMPRRLPCAH